MITPKQAAVKEASVTVVPCMALYGCAWNHAARDDSRSFRRQCFFDLQCLEKGPHWP